MVYIIICPKLSSILFPFSTKQLKYCTRQSCFAPDRYVLNHTVTVGPIQSRLLPYCHVLYQTVTAGFSQSWLAPNNYGTDGRFHLQLQLLYDTTATFHNCCCNTVMAVILLAQVGISGIIQLQNCAILSLIDTQYSTNKQTKNHAIPKGFINLLFLQKWGRQKPFWDGARLRLAP